MTDSGDGPGGSLSGSNSGVSHLYDTTMRVEVRTISVAPSLNPGCSMTDTLESVYRIVETRNQRCGYFDLVIID